MPLPSSQYQQWASGLKRQLLANKPTYKPWSEINPETQIPAMAGGYVNPYAILDEITEQFNRQPATYQTDPITGQVTATRSMPKPERPLEMRGKGFERHFAPPKSSYLQGERPAGVDDLSFSWVLPKGASTGPTFNYRQPPTSDYERAMGYNLGIEGIGGQNIAKVNPLTHWPSSAFNVPMRGADVGLPYTRPTPAWGGTVDYTTGKWYTPPTTKWGTLPTYGKFPSAQKTPPGYGRVPAMEGFRPAPPIRMSTKGFGKEYKPRRDLLKRRRVVSAISSNLGTL